MAGKIALLKSNPNNGLVFRTFNLVTDKKVVVNKETGQEVEVSKAKIVVAVNPDGENSMYIGISFCSPLDEYNRAKGRLMAKGRLGHWKKCLVAEKGKLKEAVLEAAKKEKIRWMEGLTVENLR